MRSKRDIRGTVDNFVKSGMTRRGQAYLWQYGKPGGETVFDFCLGWGREGPRKFLGAWEGILQTDGYQAYDDIGGPKLVHVGCWAHARRKFVDAVKVNPQDAAAVAMVTRMDGLFLIDRDARRRALRPESVWPNGANTPRNDCTRFARRAWLSQIPYSWSEGCFRRQNRQGCLHARI
jgi:transposase IS66 family protein